MLAQGHIAGLIAIIWMGLSCSKEPNLENEVNRDPHIPHSTHKSRDHWGPVLVLPLRPLCLVLENLRPREGPWPARAAAAVSQRLLCLTLGEMNAGRAL